MNALELIEEVTFARGNYQVEAVLGDQVHPLVELTFANDDEQQGKCLPSISCSGVGIQRLRTTVANALVRAGARHPGLLPRDLAELHAAARKEGHIELFVDINALVQGLAKQVIQSLGSRVARVVTSSSSVDVLHEYQAFARRHHNGTEPIIAAWELARGLRELRELREPVYVHQLAPGAARYFRRSHADQRDTAADRQENEYHEGATYISEDRQMVAAFWNYLSSGAPRIPIFLVTADLSLAHVCAAERVPFVFARAPREELDPIQPPSLWFDPFALSYRTCPAQAILWELTLVLGKINVRATSGGAGFESFSLEYQPRTHRPGTPEEIVRGDLIVPAPSAGSPSPAAGKRSSTASSGTPPPVSASQRMFKLSLASVIEVLPTAPGQRIPFSSFGPKDEDAIRQLWQIGAQTGLFSQDGDKVVAGDALPGLLKALSESDYLRVNDVFRKVPAYDRVLQEAAENGVFPSSKAAGAAKGWAVILGAAYKLPGQTTHGLADVSDEQFEKAIVRAHRELAGRESAVLLARVLDRVCNELQISPIRFEAMLSRTLGKRSLRDFEAQRALSNEPIPAHRVLVAPATSTPQSYLRAISPGEGIQVGGKLVGSLVRRTGR
jgi:hypothetical protein